MPIGRMQSIGVVMEIIAMAIIGHMVNTLIKETKCVTPINNNEAATVFGTAAPPEISVQVGWTAYIIGL